MLVLQELVAVVRLQALVVVLHVEPVAALERRDVVEVVDAEEVADVEEEVVVAAAVVAVDSSSKPEICLKRELRRPWINSRRRYDNRAYLLLLFALFMTPYLLEMKIRL